MHHMAELITLMMLRPKWKDAEFLLTTALYRVDKGLANRSIWVTLTVQLLQKGAASLGGPWAEGEAGNAGKENKYNDAKLLRLKVHAASRLWLGKHDCGAHHWQINHTPRQHPI